jgi:hypothetical protein
MQRRLAVAIVLVAFLVSATKGYSQHWSVGANMGLSVMDGTAGFHFTPVAEYLVNPAMGIGSEFSANTQYVSPVLWYPYFRYYFGISNSRLRPYANAGPLFALHLSSSPSFGILLGGGVNIPVTGKLSLAPDLVFGPVFGVGGATYPFILPGSYWGYNTWSLGSFNIPSRTIFVYSVRAAIRVEL